MCLNETSRYVIRRQCLELFVNCTWKVSSASSNKWSTLKLQICFWQLFRKKCSSFALRDRKHWKCTCKTLHSVKKHLCNMGSFCKKKTRQRKKEDCLEEEVFVIISLYRTPTLKKNQCRSTWYLWLRQRVSCFSQRLTLKRRFY